MMTKNERIFSFGVGIASAAVVGIVAKHIFNPDMITQAVVNSIAVTATAYVGFLAYESFKEGLTGQRQ